MDKQKVLELLQRASLDCDRVIEKGFGPDLNVLTIKKQIDDAAVLVGAEGKDEKAEIDEHPVAGGSDMRAADIQHLQADEGVLGFLCVVAQIRNNQLDRQQAGIDVTGLAGGVGGVRLLVQVQQRCFGDL